MRPYRVAALSALLAAVPVCLPAQSYSFGAGGMYATLNGDDFAGINAGLGGDVQFRYHTAKGFSIGGGAQFTSHGVEGVDPNFGVRAFFVDARYAFEQPSAPAVVPYIGARVGLAHYGVSSGGSTLSANGTAFGPTGGILVRLSPTMQMDLGIAWLSARFGNFSVDGTEQPDSKSSGSALAVRAGVVLGFGKK